MTHVFINDEIDDFWYPESLLAIMLSADNDNHSWSKQLDDAEKDYGVQNFSLFDRFDICEYTNAKGDFAQTPKNNLEAIK